MESWPRSYFQATDQKPFLFFVLFGEFEPLGAMRRSIYRSNGLPVGVDLMHYNRGDHGSVFDDFLRGYLWEQFHRSTPALAEEVSGAKQCFILRGAVEDQESLDYLRDTIGMLAFLADHGGVAIYDPQMFGWFSIEDWKQKFFDTGKASPRHHVTILFSNDTDGLWFHTRGMRKFGRPDLSMHQVDEKTEPIVVEVFSRFIEFMGFGGVIEEGSEIRVSGFPKGYRCHHKGSLDDPDFNNYHVEIQR